MRALFVALLASAMTASTTPAALPTRSARELAPRPPECPPNLQAAVNNRVACDPSTQGHLLCEYNHLWLGCPPDPLRCEAISWCRCESRWEGPQPALLFAPHARGEWQCATMAMTQFCPGGPGSTPEDRLQPCSPEEDGSTPFPSAAPSLDCRAVARRRKCKKAKNCKWKQRKKKCVSRE